MSWLFGHVSKRLDLKDKVNLNFYDVTAWLTSNCNTLQPTGRTACGKTFFTQKLAINIFFGKLKKTEWVSYIDLTKEREAEIQSCFNCEAEFHYPILNFKF